ncbi:hypothetical protein MNBD_GAMMA11-1312 [hydrothermal vent metagenome]|uniref:Uncharacterized protein n=1 Tax=hydrothermal vent metagenome TaxID=652676 RepID=A0A3B0X6H6_9ZZZZ
MCGLLSKLFFCSLSLLLLVPSVSLASVNPFQKSKSYNFGADVSWSEHNGAAIKSGSVQDGGDTRYYHLNINKRRLRLRLGKNNPDGELGNTRQLESLAIADVMVNGRRLPVFDWCLHNQRNPGKKLKQSAVVANNTCLNVGGGGDFIIRLDARTRDILKKSDTLTFIVEPFGRPVKLRYSLSGFAAIMVKIDRPVIKPKPARKPVPVSKPVVRANKPEPRPRRVPATVKVKPVPAVKPGPVVKKVKMCNALPPADFRPQVKSVAYPCANSAKKLSAEKKVLELVKEKQREVEAAQESEHQRLKAAAESERNVDWDNKQAELWISRCDRHWKKGTSPCYCDKYIKSAPPGVKSTCKK